MEKKLKPAVYLETRTQRQLAALFGRSQGWLSAILKKHPECRLFLVDGNVKKIVYFNKVEKLAKEQKK